MAVDGSKGSGNRGRAGGIGSERMAQIVLGIGTAHSTQCSMTTDWWVEHGRLDPETTPFEELLRKAPSWMADEIKPEILQQKHTRVQQAIARLGETIHEVAPDVLVVVGD